jgi:hypothetical protein
MASRNGAVGSSSWISSERELARTYIDFEVKEFVFSAQNEVEWLNEHMAEIFSNAQLYVQLD